MDLYNLTMKIPYVLMLIVGVTLSIQLYVGGLNTLSMDIDSYDEGKYRSVVVLENTLSVQENASEVLGYNYDHRRAVTPIEFYTNNTNDEDGIGFMKNGDHCHIPRVAGLDGEDFGYYIRKTDSNTNANLNCTTRPVS